MVGNKKKFHLANNEENKNTQEEKMVENQIEEQNKEFAVFDEDIILSKVDFINYQKIRNKILFLKFHLMGRFDEKGNYYINNDIKKDLIKVEKEIQYEDEKEYIAYVKFANITFQFQVEISYINDMAKARLYINESINDKNIKSLLDEFEDLNDKDFRIKVRQRYNLFDVATTVKDEQIPNLSIWIYWQTEEELYWHDLYEIGSQFFVMRALKILEKYGELGAEIIKKYNEKISVLENGKPRTNAQAKDILDDIINSFGGMEKIDNDKGELKELVKTFNKPFFAQEKTNKVQEIIPMKKVSKSVKEGDATSRERRGSVSGKTVKSSGEKSSTTKKKKETKKDAEKTANPGRAGWTPRTTKVQTSEERQEEKDDYKQKNTLQTEETINADANDKISFQTRQEIQEELEETDIILKVETNEIITSKSKDGLLENTKEEFTISDAEIIER